MKSTVKSPIVRALAESMNLATVRLGLDVGLEQVADTLEELRAERPRELYPSLLLGAVELSPIRVAELYNTLANGGFYSPLRAVHSVVDGEGRTLQRYSLAIEQVAEPVSVYALNQALVQVMERGTGRSARRALPNRLRVAGKTGTSDDLRDSWFAGFSNDYLTVAWIGNDRNEPIGLTGGAGAAQVWARVMAQVAAVPVRHTAARGCAQRLDRLRHGALDRRGVSGRRQRRNPRTAGAAESGRLRQHPHACRRTVAPMDPQPVRRLAGLYPAAPPAAALRARRSVSHFRCSPAYASRDGMGPLFREQKSWVSSRSSKKRCGLAARTSLCGYSGSWSAPASVSTTAAGVAATRPVRRQPRRPTPASWRSSSRVGIVVVIALVILKFVSNAALIEGVKRARGNAPFTWREGFREGWAHWGVLLRIALVFLAASVGSAVLLFGGCYLIGQAFGLPTMLVTAVVALVIAVPLFVTLHMWQAFAERIAVLENRRALDAIAQGTLVLARPRGARVEARRRVVPRRNHRHRARARRDRSGSSAAAARRRACGALLPAVAIGVLVVLPTAFVAISMIGIVGVVGLDDRLPHGGRAMSAPVVPTFDFAPPGPLLGRCSVGRVLQPRCPCGSARTRKRSTRAPC